MKICLFDHVFSQAPPINWLLWQQWMTYPKILILKNDLYIFLKVRKFGEDRLNRFWDI